MSKVIQFFLLFPFLVKSQSISIDTIKYTNIEKLLTIPNSNLKKEYYEGPVLGISKGVNVIKVTDLSSGTITRGFYIDLSKGNDFNWPSNFNSYCYFDVEDFDSLNTFFNKCDIWKTQKVNAPTEYVYTFKNYMQISLRTTNGLTWFYTFNIPVYPGSIFNRITYRVSKNLFEEYQSYKEKLIELLAK